MTTARFREPGALARFERVFVGINRWLVIGLMASMATLVFINVIMRYLGGRSLIWVEELTQYQMIWVAWLGAGLALREGRHVAVDLLPDALPRMLQRFSRQLLAAAMAVFLLVLMVLGLQIVQFTWSQETPVLGWPAGLPYLAVPVGAACMLVHLLLFWREFVARDFEVPPELDAEER